MLSVEDLKQEIDTTNVTNWKDATPLQKFMGKYAQHKSGAKFTTEEFAAYGKFLEHAEYLNDDERYSLMEKRIVGVDAGRLSWNNTLNYLQTNYQTVKIDGKDVNLAEHAIKMHRDNEARQRKAIAERVAEKQVGQMMAAEDARSAAIRKKEKLDKKMDAATLRRKDALDAKRQKAAKLGSERVSDAANRKATKPGDILKRLADLHQMVNNLKNDKPGYKQDFERLNIEIDSLGQQYKELEKQQTTKGDIMSSGERTRVDSVSSDGLGLGDIAELEVALDGEVGDNGWGDAEIPAEDLEIPTPFEQRVADILYKFATGPEHDFREVLSANVKEEIHREYAATHDSPDQRIKRTRFEKPGNLMDAALTGSEWQKFGAYVMDTEADRKNVRDTKLGLSGLSVVENNKRVKRLKLSREKARRELMNKGLAAKVVSAMFPNVEKHEAMDIEDRMSVVLNEAGEPTALSKPLFGDYIYVVQDPASEVARNPVMHAMHEHPILRQMAVAAAQENDLSPSADRASALESDLRKYGLEAEEITLTASAVKEAMAKSHTKCGRGKIVEAVGMAVAMEAVEAASAKLTEHLNKDRAQEEGRLVSTEFSLSKTEQRRLAEKLVDQMHSAIKSGMKPKVLLDKMNHENGKGFLREALVGQMMNDLSNLKQYARVGVHPIKRTYMPGGDGTMAAIAGEVFSMFTEATLDSAEVKKIADGKETNAMTPSAKLAIRGRALAKAAAIIDDGLIQGVREGQSHPLKRADGPAIPAQDFDLQSTVRRHMIEEVANHIVKKFARAGTEQELLAQMESDNYVEKMGSALVREMYASRNNDVNDKMKFAHFGEYKENALSKFFKGYSFSGRPEFGTLQSGALDKLLAHAIKSHDSTLKARPYYGRSSASSVIDRAIEKARESGVSMPEISAEVRREMSEALAAKLSSTAKDGRALTIDEVVTALNTKGNREKSAMERLAEMPQQVDKGAVTLASLSDGTKWHQSKNSKRSTMYDDLLQDLGHQKIASIPLKAARASIIAYVNANLYQFVCDNSERRATIHGMSRKLEKLVDGVLREHFEQDNSRVSGKDVTALTYGISRVLLNGVGEKTPDYSLSQGIFGKSSSHQASRSTYGVSHDELRDALRASVAKASKLDEIPGLEFVHAENVPDSVETTKQKAAEAKAAAKAEKDAAKRKLAEDKAAAAALKAEDTAEVEAATEVAMKLSLFDRVKRMFTRQDLDVLRADPSQLVDESQRLLHSNPLATPHHLVEAAAIGDTMRGVGTKPGGAKQRVVIKRSTEAPGRA